MDYIIIQAEVFYNIIIVITIAGFDEHRGKRLNGSAKGYAASEAYQSNQRSMITIVNIVIVTDVMIYRKCVNAVV